MQQKKPLSPVNKFAIALGIFLIIEGIGGLVGSYVFWIFSTNVLHASIHLLLGFSGLYIGLRNHARKFSLYVGLLLLVVGVLYFTPATNALAIKILNVNDAVAYLNIIIGVTAILFAFLSPKKVVAQYPHQQVHAHK